MAEGIFGGTPTAQSPDLAAQRAGRLRLIESIFGGVGTPVLPSAQVPSAVPLPVNLGVRGAGDGEANKLGRGFVTESPTMAFDKALDAFNLTKSPFGRLALAAIPGGAIFGGGVRAAANQTISEALGVKSGIGEAITSAFGGRAPGADAANTVGLEGRDFDTPTGVRPVAGGIVTRSHDRFGPPRGEADNDGGGGGFGKGKDPGGGAAGSPF